MAKNLGSSGGAATLQRSKLDVAKQVQVVQPRVDDNGGGGGIGNKIFNGGGGGGDDDDDDDYFNEGGDDNGDDGKDPFWRKALPQLYDKLSVEAVLSEWYRSVADLPAIIRDLAALGVLSSAQIVGLLRLDGRPNLVRTVARRLPQRAARNYVGRMMADPGFTHKLLFESTFTFLTSLMYEMRVRKERFSKELDLVLVNCLSMSIATGLAVWAVAPNKSRGALAQAPWQEMLKKTPNNVFEASNPINGPYSMPMRVGSFFKTAAELCGIYGVAGATGAAISHGLAATRQMRDSTSELSVAVASPTESLGKVGCFGLLQNVRYQALAGVDRGLRDNCNRAWFWKAAPIPLRVLPYAVMEGWVPCPDVLRRQWYQGLPLHVEPSVPQPQVVVAQQAPVVKKATKKRRKSSAGFEVSLSPPPPPQLAYQPTA